MHAFDIIAISTLIIFITIGVSRGFIEEIFHLTAMLGGFTGAFLSYPFIFRKINFLKISAQTKTVISFILAYIIIALILLILGWILKKIVHMTILGLIDRLFGGFIGLGKATIIIWIFVLSVAILPSSKLKSAFTSSKTYTLLTKLPVRLNIPQSKRLNRSYKKLKKSIPVDKLKDTKEKFDKFKNDTRNSFKPFSDST